MTESVSVWKVQPRYNSTVAQPGCSISAVQGGIGMCGHAWGTMRAVQARVERSSTCSSESWPKRPPVSAPAPSMGPMALIMGPKVPCSCCSFPSARWRVSGNCSRRSVWPVGAVSNTTVSYSRDCISFMTSAKDIASSMPGIAPVISAKNPPSVSLSPSISSFCGLGSTSCNRAALSGFDVSVEGLPECAALQCGRLAPWQRGC